MKRFFWTTLYVLFTVTMIYSQAISKSSSREEIFCLVSDENVKRIDYRIVKNNQTLNQAFNAANITRGKSNAYKTIKCLESDSSDLDIFSGGIGLGMDYGGIGANLLIYPQRNIGIFAGVGHAIAGIGYNFGVKCRYLMKSNASSSVSMHIIGMYGYNAAVAVLNDFKYNKLFYGPTFGFGIDYKSDASNKGYWTFSLLVPIRDSKPSNYINDLELGGVEFKNELFPIAISIGYRIIKN